MKVVIYALTLTSAWGNGHATTYRSLAKALARRGHTVRFIEKDVEWYASHRDLPDPDFCSVRLYADWSAEEGSLIAEAMDADAVIVGSYFPDAVRAIPALRSAVSAPMYFYDIDTPITMEALRTGTCDYLTSALIPEFDAYLSFTGGPALSELQQQFRARVAIPFYCSVDPDIYKPAPRHVRFDCDLSYLGTYASDRQPKLMTLLNSTAERLPDASFLVAGAMYPETVPWQANVRRLAHVAPPDHPAFYSSCRFTLNLTRADMVATGWSPSVRLFEASACGVAILSDRWDGLEQFLTPGQEVLLPSDAAEVAAILTGLSDEERTRMGQRARERILREHTSEHRAQQFEAIVSAGRRQDRERLPEAAQGTMEEASPALVL